MVLTKLVLLLPCDAPAGGAAGGGVSVAGGASAVVSSSSAGEEGATVVSQLAGGGGASAAVSPSPAGGANVGQLPLASGVEPSGHDCAYEICSIEDDDCTVRIAAVISSTTIIIEGVLFMVFFTMNIKEIGRFYPLCEQRCRNSEKKRKEEIFII